MCTNVLRIGFFHSCCEHFKGRKECGKDQRSSFSQHSQLCGSFFCTSEAINETAAITPSLKNTLLSVVAGGVVLAAIAAAASVSHLLIRSRESKDKKELLSSTEKRLFVGVPRKCY